MYVKSRGLVANPEARGIIDVAVEHQSRFLAHKKAEQTLNAAELEKVHTFVDLMRQDWKREEKGLFCLMDHPHEKWDSGGQSAFTGSIASGRGKVSRAADIERTSTVGLLSPPGLYGTWKTTGHRPQPSTTSSKSGDESVALNESSVRNRSDLAHVECRARNAWWQKFPCTVVDNSEGLSTPEKRFLGRMSSTRVEQKHQHRLYDWVPPDAGGGRQPKPDKIKQPKRRQRNQKYVAKPNTLTKRKPPQKREYHQPLSSHSEVATSSILRSSSTAHQSNKLRAGRTKHESVSTRLYQCPTVAWQMKKTRDPDATAAEAALGAAHRRRAIVNATTRHAAPAPCTVTSTADAADGVSKAEKKILEVASTAPRIEAAYKGRDSWLCQNYDPT